jgi:membrane protease YdiL (CAAX protease family)
MSLSGFGRSGEFPQFSALAFLFYNIISFGYGEETGWRGFALPRLQSRFSAFTATIVLTLGWAIWHIPLFFYRPGYMGMGVAEIMGWAFSLLTGAVLLSWLYNESRGSILVVALFHATIDIVFTSDMVSQFVVNSIGVLITSWGIVVLIVAGPRYLSVKGKMVRLYNDRSVTGFKHK